MSADDFKQFRAEVLQATDIVSLVSDYVALKRAGRSYKGLCPFHDEKTPSFHVNPDRRTWHCFGRCARGGNAVDFVIEKEGLPFWEALCLLAERAGIAAPARGGEPGEASERQRARRANEAAQDFFRRALLESREAEEARAYVERRGIDPEVAERFALGYAPRSGHHLLGWLRRRDVTEADAEAAGLYGRKEQGGMFARFRERLMFPIHDLLGRVVGFGGRGLTPEALPKYKNTPETALFKKRELVYGLHLAKEAARERNEVAIVEGYTDVILAHQAGFPHTVATLGTAFGAAHARELRRIASRVVVFFDGDAAGEAANLRGLEELALAVFQGAQPFEALSVAALPDGLDPADLVLERGAAALEEAMRGARSLVDFLLPERVLGAGTGEKVEALRRAARVLSAFESDAYREVQLAEVAHRLGVSERVVREEAVRARKAGASKPPAGGASSAAPPAAREVRAPAEGGGPADAPRKARPGGGGVPRVERWALRCLLGSEALRERARAEGLAERLTHPLARGLAEALVAGAAAAELEDPEARRLAASIAAELDEEIDYAREWEGVTHALERRRTTRRPADDDGALRALQESYRRLKARARSG